MELSLDNGRYSADPAGGLATVTGAEETAQRTLMRLTARRGGFAPWPDFGSRLWTLPSLLPSERESAARQFIAEALSDQRDAAVTHVRVSEDGDGTLSVSLTLTGPEGALELDFTI